MTRLEKQVMRLSADLANTMKRLPAIDRRTHHDTEDAYFHIRAIQSILLARDGLKKTPIKK